MTEFIKLSQVDDIYKFNEYIKSAAEIESRSFADCWNERTLCELLSMTNYDIIVSVSEGLVTGYCCFSLLFDEAEILRIAVIPEKRNCGQGYVLLEHILKMLSTGGASNVFLEVRTGNIPARRLYEKLGFENIYVRENYYSDGEDAVVYRKSI